MAGLFGVMGDWPGAAYDPSELVREGKASGSKPASTEMRMQILEANLAKALLISEALWEVLKQELKVTEKQLCKKMHEVDMRDGSADGKNQRKAVECPNCGHMVSPRHPGCLYCGHIIDNSLFSIG